ncbi:diguanylate cyclase (GGDEF) domain-containing protein [Eubacterium ruminantium]|uniref:Diguanylate cyclase (GGDEF) domain-containing protein n=2 Tax=Eubacterium ruminantium TaxID=42322 RepID=A0A1T4QT42_9FIRM|nr:MULTISPECIES: diguanylate cyclase [Eubacterium]MCR5367801.1 sensor domain-containing diguanylate cyclase [Eubacterium sp.]SCW69636.1 diguanylate cyclase (GGDEF) domain-containing protein [Eubacterium ruminantium]SDN15673.1 diguanylate cyclase (GGDEF) domain-containing protein [Eubacterium ruminantium]SKA06890.1 diguanylate cyclase (GGDEF) domain-containing protein [Eubacterium ruminantium]
MKKIDSNKNRNNIRLIKGSQSYHSVIAICLVIFLVAIAMLISTFNSLIRQHDEKLSGEICTLFSEKMSNSISFMTDSARDISSILSIQDFDSPEEIYEILKTYDAEKIQSIGFIDENDKIYSKDTEETEFAKWNLLKTAKLASPVSISAPYRSTKLGQPVITIFAKFTYGRSKQGYIYLTYLFKTLQDVATTESLNNEIEIWLMDAKSSNIIQCVGSDPHASGSWANALLAMSDINADDKSDYDKWYNKMLAGEPSASVGYKIQKTYYSQFCSAIESMPGWYVVVRIPSNALSATMKVFRNHVIIFLLVLLVIVFVLISKFYSSWKRENKILSQLSINDPLTGALNRRAFELAATYMLSKSKEAALIFFDIDYFKQVNDSYGHDIGDKLLTEFSDVLYKNFSDNALISRYGGDEFVVLVHMSSVDNVTAKLKQATDDVHAIHLTDSNEQNDSDKKLVISFSAGAARYPYDASTLTDLQKCADSALYTVKEQGRNAYLWHQDLPSDQN